MKNSNIRRLGSGRLPSRDARQDRRNMSAVVAARTASKEEMLANVAPAVSPRTIGKLLLAAGLRSRVPLVKLPLIGLGSVLGNCPVGEPWMRKYLCIFLV